jgi:hypothetical protein
MKWANEHPEGVIDIAESNGGINDGIEGRLDHVQFNKTAKKSLLI